MRELVSMIVPAPAAILPGMAVAYRSIQMGDFEIMLASAKRRETAFVAGIATPRSSDITGSITVATEGTIDLTTDQWDAATGRHGGLLTRDVPVDLGSTYYLADEPGMLSNRPGNWKVMIGVAIGAGVLRLRIGKPALRLTDRVVESAWLRNDRHAIALVFEDNEQQIFDVFRRDPSTDDGTLLSPTIDEISFDGHILMSPKGAGPIWRGPTSSIRGPLLMSVLPLLNVDALDFTINEQPLRIVLSDPGYIKQRVDGVLTLDEQSWTEL